MIGPVDAVILAMDAPRFIVVIETFGHCAVCEAPAFCRVNRDDRHTTTRWHHACRQHVGTVVAIMVEANK